MVAGWRKQKRGKTLNSSPSKILTTLNSLELLAILDTFFWYGGLFTLPGTRKTLNSLFLFVFRVFACHFLGQPGPFLCLSGRAFHAILSALVWVLFPGAKAFIRSKNTALVIPLSPLPTISTRTEQAARHDVSQRAASTVTISCSVLVFSISVLMTLLIVIVDCFWFIVSNKNCTSL